MFFKLLQPPIIIIGMHRSGTTMLAELLEQAGVFIGGDFTAYHESNYFQKQNDQLLSAAGATWDEPIETDNAPRLPVKNFITEYASASRKPQSFISLLLQKKWGWKDPRNTFTLGSWLKMFPKLKVVHIIRNGVDVSISLFERNVALQAEDKWYSPQLATPEACFNLWEQYVSEGQHWKAQLLNNYLEVRYEDLVNKSLISISALENFTGLKFSNNAMDLIKTEKRNKSQLPVYLSLKEYANQSPLFSKLNYATRR